MSQFQPPIHIDPPLVTGVTIQEIREKGWDNGTEASAIRAVERFEALLFKSKHPVTSAMIQGHSK